MTGKMSRTKHLFEGIDLMSDQISHLQKCKVSVRVSDRPAMVEICVSAVTSASSCDCGTLV